MSVATTSTSLGRASSARTTAACTARRSRSRRCSSGELLAPTKACNKLAFREADNAAVADLFNVSTQFAQMQMKGPRQYAKYALAKQAKARK
jgi:hypothetical protein